MNRTYVMSDLHGHYDIFIKMLKKIKFDETDCLYILGDCCDRGDHSFEIYSYIRAHHNIILLKGNHEVLMKNALLSIDSKSDENQLWQRNGGLKTRQNYHRILKKPVFKEPDYHVLKSMLHQSIVDYIDHLPNYLEITVNRRNYLLVHAGIDPKIALEDQSERDLVWIRENFFNYPTKLKKIVIFGHTPTKHLHNKESLDIWYDEVYQDKIGIDGGLGSYFFGQLNCLCLDDHQTYCIKKNRW